MHDMLPDAVVFDLDGTLVDSAPDIQQALNFVLEADGVAAVDLPSVRLMIGGGPRVLIERALRKLDVATDVARVDRLTADFRVAYTKQGNKLTRLYPGARNCLTQLRQQGMAVGLCSNKPESNCEQVLTDLGIRGLFDVVQGSASGLPMKPDPAPLLATVDRLGRTKERVLYVGDSKTDVDTARSAGVAVALVRSGYTAIPADSLGADLVIDGLADIPSTLRQP
jgi:phosphoglycolate phosphatase